MSQLFSRLAALLAVAALSVASAAAAASSDPTYTVTGVHVDASGPSANAAEHIAIEQGRARAFDVVFKRIARPGDAGKEPKLDGDALRRLMRGFTVANEKRSTTRYVADVTYVFSPEAVSRLMGTVAPGYRVLGSVRRILLIPMAPTFDLQSPWTSAFSSPRFAGSFVPFTVPTGDAPDVKALSLLKFDATNWPDVQIVAARIHASEVVLALAIPLTQGGTSTSDKMTGKVQVWLKRIGVAEMPTKTSVDVPLIKNPAQTYPLAADAAVHAIEVMFQQRPPIDFGPRATLSADVHIDSLEQWNAMQSSMGLVANVVAVQVVAMDIGLVRINLTYQGSTDQLHDALVPVGIAISKTEDGQWSMAYAPPPPKPTASDQ